MKCQGPWCDMLVDFARLFDSGDPAQIQQGVDMYTEWPNNVGSIKVALTRRDYCAINHERVQSILGFILPRGLVSWSLDPTLYQVDLPGRGEGVVTIARNGTFSVNLNYFYRRIFWSTYVESLPRGEFFPYTTVTSFHNCDSCPALGLLDLKEGGLDGDKSKGWRVVGVTLLKLA